jgi:hypothetical protein
VCVRAGGRVRAGRLRGVAPFYGNGGRGGWVALDIAPSPPPPAGLTPLPTPPTAHPAPPRPDPPRPALTRPDAPLTADVCANEGLTILPVEIAPPTWANELEPLLQVKEAARAEAAA